MVMRVDVVSLEASIFTGEAEMVFAPAEGGEVGIAPRHAPFLTRLKPGELRIQMPGETLSFFVSGGILEVQPHQVTVLANTTIRTDTIDEARTLEAKQAAEAALAMNPDTIDVARAEAELLEMSERLRVLERVRKRGQLK
ncbi:ATPase, F1 complex, delta/epsilon subunit [mine drainage metagenome]|uniref:ATPase, F1 complex, delta/epsilon subunit n=2 Tax=mine drainage metagenome TaxID=410659 RepID=T1BU46_9ZZZZ